MKFLTLVFNIREDVYMNKENKQEEYRRITMEANEAKERLDRIVYELEELGYIRKANSLKNLIYKIEYWQNTNP